jgi:hypothetical protein
MASRDFSPPESVRIFLSTVVAGELECPRQVPQRPKPILGKILLQLFGDSEIGIEYVQGLLREVAHIQAGAEPHASRIWSTGPGNHFKKRSLTSAVSPHDGPAFSAADREIEPFVNHTRAVTLVQILKDGHLFARSWGGTRKSNFTTCLFLGSSIFSILSKALVVLDGNEVERVNYLSNQALPRRAGMAELADAADSKSDTTFLLSVNK